MKIARDNCLIYQAYGGTAILATPEVQRGEGIRRMVLDMHECEEADND
jgi:hypothetical protein